MIRACVIGLKGVGATHAEAYRQDKLGELAGICDSDAPRLRAAGARLRAPGFGSASEMLEALKPDLVSIYAADPAPIIMQALEFGCDVLCEAPLGRDAAQARELVAAARSAGRRLAVNFNLRFTPAALKAKQWVDGGRLGTLLFINAALWSGGDDTSCLGVGSAWGLAVAGLDLMRWLCGDVARLQCFGTQSSESAAPTSAQINVAFTSPIVGSLTVSCDMAVQHPLARCEVAGTTARLVVDNIFEGLTLYPHAEEEATVITNSIWGGNGLGSYDDTHRFRIHRLLEQIAAGAGPDDIEGSGAEAAAAQEAVEAAIRSVETGDVVTAGRET